MTDSPVPSGSARPARALDIISVAFVALLLISNIAATKAFMVGSSTHYLIFDGGAILFPLTYIIGDVLSEVYGFARARRVIVMGFVASFLLRSLSSSSSICLRHPTTKTRRLSRRSWASYGVRLSRRSRVTWPGSSSTPTCSCGSVAAGVPSTCGRA